MNWNQFFWIDQPKQFGRILENLRNFEYHQKTLLKIQSITIQYFSSKYAISSNRNGIQTKNQKRVSKLGSWEIMGYKKLVKDILNKTKLKVNNSLFHIVDPIVK